MNEPQETVSAENANLSIEVIKSAQIEAQSQLSALINAVQKCRPKSTGAHALASDDEINEWIKRINEEKRKVAALQLTLAFVGTMKAGKSTCINAIVGCEILPNRNTAMTILPTVITHTPGCFEPVLTFEKREPFDEAIKSIKSKLVRLDKDAGGHFILSGDENCTLSRIRVGDLAQLQEQYFGQIGIYAFMESINDIARICNDPRFDVENPLDKYVSVDEFPQISIEFSCLNGRIKMDCGKLSLIDTPGPNEAGQGHLKAVVKEQLRRASAIVSVLDYTQLNSEADEEVRQWVIEAQKHSGVKLYVFVNKFDQKQRKDKLADEKNLKAYVREKLYCDRCEADGSMLVVADERRIFPISAIRAFLANLAQREISSHGKLPDLDNADWVEKFAIQAYGAAEWEGDIQSLDIEKHRVASAKMWEASRMEEPLTQVIAESLARIVPFCLNAALISVKTTATCMQNGLTVRRKSMECALHDLESAVKRMNDRLNRIRVAEKNALVIKDQALDRLKKDIANEFDELQTSVGGVLTKMAKAKGAALEQKKQEEDTHHFNGFHLFSRLRDDKAKMAHKILTGNEPLDFNDEEEAYRFVADLLSTVRKATVNAFEKSISRLKDPVNCVRRELGKSIQKEVQPILDEMGKDAHFLFGVNFQVPSPKLGAIELDFVEMERQHVKLQVEKGVYHERRWYTLWLCKHAVPYENKKYRVNPVEIRNSIGKRIEASLAQVRMMLNDYIQDVFDQHATLFFSQVGDAFQHLQSSVNDGIKLKKLEGEEQKKVVKEIDEMSTSVTNMAKRAERHAEFIDEQFAI